MFRVLKLTIFMTLALIILGCASTQTSRLDGDAHRELTPEQRRVQQQLKAQHQSWAGTPYRNGGLSPSGVDCSGFVYLTFRDQLGRSVPRTTREQARQGRRVAQSDLRPGDLVFFRTGFKTRHVGIYMGEGQFLHASTSNGVMISALADPYWQRSYWQGRRLNTHNSHIEAKSVHLDALLTKN